jgi:hypothetical protein
MLRFKWRNVRTGGKDRRTASLFKEGWSLSEDGVLTPLVLANFETSNLRPAINAHIARTQRATEDPSLLLGIAKDLLETVSRYVLNELKVDLPRTNPDFDELLFFALNNLQLHPVNVTVTDEVSKAQLEVFDGLLKAARGVNSLRNLDETGHGRFGLPKNTAITARAVVQAAGVMAQRMVTALDARLQP